MIPLEGEILRGAEQKAEKNEAKVRSGFWVTAAKAATKIPFMQDVIACYYCALDPKTPTKVRAILLAALAYFVLPLDSIPDFIAGFGFTDDIAVLWAVINSLKGHIKPEHTDLASSKMDEFRRLAEPQSSPEQ